MGALLRKYPTAGAFDPFAPGFARMWQDSAGTTPVTAYGQPVGRLQSLGGAVTFIQPTTTSRPTLQANGLVFDGTDDGMYSAINVDLSGTDKLTVAAGIYKTSDSARGMLLEHRAGSSAASYWFVHAPSAAGAGNAQFSSSGAFAAATAAINLGVVISGVSNMSGPTASIWRNGTLIATSATAQSGGAYTSDVMFLGRRNNATLPFNGYISRFAWFPVLLAAADLRTLEQWVALPMGLSIP